MTKADIAELEWLLAAYRAAPRGCPTTISRTRKRLETALVRHADELIAAAKAQDK